MTGIQALERSAPDRPMTDGHCRRIDFEYTRHGTPALLGDLEVTTDELIACTIGPARTGADFAGHIEQPVATDPEAGWVFVVDHLNIHGSEALVRWVAEACGTEGPLGKAEQVAQLHRILPSGVRQAVPVDVHRRSAASQAGGMGRGKRPRMGRSPGSCPSN